MAWTKTEKDWLDERLRGMEGRLNARMDSLDAKQEQTLQQVKLTNGRVTSLEKSRTWTKGAAWAFGTVIGLLIMLTAWIGANIVNDVKANTEYRQHQEVQ